MARNEWINGYLEAILDAGAHKLEEKNEIGTHFKFSPTKYFVEEVVNSFDESDLHRTWVKVIATRNTRERNNRLENMCWRIWHLARKKKHIEWEDARGLAERRFEREQGRHDAAEDLSELSEGEKEKGDTSQSETPKDKIPRINSEMHMWSDEDKSKHLYIVLISLHGLVRGENMELGRDSDTGGQVKYVVELARALAATKGVYRVDLLTRQISSPEVDWSYGEPVEMLTTRSDDADPSGDSSGAYIIRLPCGPRERYIPKESLWPHIPEFVDRAVAHIVDVASALGNQLDGGKPTWPYVIHGHYADAGEVAAHLSGALNVPMVLTGHSLGRNKFEQLLKQGRLTSADINSTYKIMRRIEGEELGLDAAEMVVTSTRQEIDEQWGLYDGFDVKLERKLRVRRRRGVSCFGRYMPRMVVIPPGMDFSYVKTQESLEGDGDLSSLIGPDRTQSRRNLPPIWSEIMRFFTNPHKPMILALSRPDPKKNVMTLVKAFGECRALRELANMTLILGNRDDIEEMSSSSATVLTNVLKLIDRYDLYGQVAYPKHHKQSDVPEIYRLAAKTKGVFINPALVEPFGLTLIEAAAYGLPVVATKNGGPVDIIKALNNGLLVDPHDQKAISDALLKLVAEKSLWLECRKTGLKNIHRFSWPEHCRNYLSHVDHCRSRHPTSLLDIAPHAEEPLSDSLRDVEDLSIRFSVDSDLKINGDLDSIARQRVVVDKTLTLTLALALSMVSLLCNSTAIRLPKPHFSPKPDHAPRPAPRFCTRRARHPPSITASAAASGTGSSSNAEPPKRPLPPPQQMRTLFPGGFKRPEIKAPTLVLQLNSDEVLRSEDALDAVDVAVSKWAGIVVLDAGEGSGGRLYEAARALKSVIGERAYLLITERVDVAAAVGASGVVLSDQGLPAIVARNMMMESKTESVVLPLVGRTVQTRNSALIASNSEGADFLILVMDRDKYAEVLDNSAYQHVKVPIFTMIASLGEGPRFAAAAKFLQSGASGLVISLEDIKLFSDDALDQLLTGYKMNRLMQSELQISNKHEMNLNDGFNGRNGVSGFTKIEDKEKQFIEVEKLVLLEAISVIRQAAPLMEEVSLLVDAVSRLDDPFLLVLAGEFNSGKSTVINALLGRRYLKEGVIPTTNEITLLCYSEMDYSGQQRCERHPDGQYICYLPAPILKEMNLVDTPGTNVILQRQQRLTEEFVPRADLLFFVISADRPLTESEVSFLRYVQQWKKRVVFVLNKSDLYQNNSELEEATAFIKENAQKLLNTEHVILFPVSARSALKAKLSASLNIEKSYEELLSNDPRWKTSGFHELETFLYSFLDGSTETGIERMRLKLETPIGIADRLLSACDTLVRQECEYARQDLISVKEIISTVKEYAMKIERESHSWRKQTFSLIKTAQARAVKLTESTLQLSNIDLVASYFFKGENSGSMPATLSIQNEIISPALSGVQKLLGEYLTWLHSSNACEGKRIKETFEKRWPTFVNSRHQVHSEAYELMGRGDEVSLQVVTNFSPSAAAKLFEQEVREVVLGTFGGLGAAGLSASLLTSVLPTTLEDLLALGLCSAGGLLAISNFPTRRKEVADKVKRAALALERELEEAMEKDLLNTIENLERLVELMGRPYHDAAQDRLNRLLEIQDELSNVGKKLGTLQVEIQNLHIA